MTTLLTHGSVTFDASTPEAFEDLVKQTLEESAHIRTDWHGERSGAGYQNVLLVHEVTDDG